MTTERYPWVQVGWRVSFTTDKPGGASARVVWYESFHENVDGSIDHDEGKSSGIAEK